MKKIPLLPNLITTGNLFCGFLSLIRSLQGDYLQAAWLILGAMVFDFFDGQVARLQKTSSAFGVEYDSLSDMVSFGVAPAILVYKIFGQPMGGIGIAVAFLYIACAALRLARYNSTTSPAEKRSFVGLPSPAAAGMIASTLILEREIPEIYPEIALSRFLPFLLIVVATLMVSNIRYTAIKAVNTLSAKPFRNLALIIGGAALVLFHLEIFVFLCFLLYMLTGLWGELLLQHHKRKSETPTLHPS